MPGLPACLECSQTSLTQCAHSCSCAAPTLSSYQALSQPPPAADADQTDTWFPKWAGCCYVRNMISLQAQYRTLRPLRDKLSHMFLFGSGKRLTTLQVKPVVQLRGM